jgi:hypothetical protein
MHEEQKNKYKNSKYKNKLQNKPWASNTGRQASIYNPSPRKYSDLNYKRLTYHCSYITVIQDVKYLQ